MRYVISSFVIILVSGFAHFFPRYYLSELALSFSPYWIVLLLLWLILSIIYVRKYLQAKKQWRGFPRYQWFAGLFTLLFGILFLIYSSQFTHFYSNTLPLGESHTGDLKVLFANIHKDNTDYTWIQKLIVQENPDMLMFVEFADHHYEHLKELFTKNYPYTNSTTRSKTFVWSTVFSKQKIENRADDFQQGMRRYGYFSLSFGGKDYYFYLVHTSSPDSYAHFVMRNEQLKTFDQDFALHEKTRPNDKVVVVGDFNLTPWSAYYTDMSQVFSGRLTNATQKFPFLFTRRFFSLPLLQAHIDHLWISSGVQLDTLKSVIMPGSDHKAYVFDISPE
jgi:endonuclease/exonuclease/phosphatase (EEP) superfamily protein YafD